MSPSLHLRATAHGKVILFGEHAVVYGCPAIAAGIPEGLELSAEPLDDPRAAMRVCIPEWALDLELRAESDHPVARACLEVLSRADGPVRGWQIHGRSRLPSRAGLGSSACLTVAIARLVLGPDADTEELIACSLAGEEVFHGAPSGVDSTIAAHGGIMKFVRGSPPQALEITEKINLAILPTGRARSTEALVAGVRARFARMPRVKGPLLDAFACLVGEAEQQLKSNDFQRLGELMNVSHGLLASLGTSSPELDALCHAARDAGALGAKLTGAGGGGCAIALLEHDASDFCRAMTRRTDRVDTPGLPDVAAEMPREPMGSDSRWSPTAAFPVALASANARALL